MSHHIFAYLLISSQISSQLIMSYHRSSELAMSYPIISSHSSSSYPILSSHIFDLGKRSRSTPRVGVDPTENEPSTNSPACLAPYPSNEQLSARQDHDLKPPRGRDGLERRKATRRHVRELQVLRHGQVAREPDAGLDRDHVEEPKHRSTTVLDLHDLVPAKSMNHANSFRARLVK